MTSTNIFHGVGERKSSRVLRPPGGGQTDVLGVKSAPEQPRQKNATPQKIVTETPKVDTKPQSVCNDAPKVEAKNANNMAAPPARSRVPPGGFSSGGFW